MPRGMTEVEVQGMSQKGYVHRDGMLLYGTDGVPVSFVLSLTTLSY